MLKKGILNPAINELLSRIRHTNTLVIADRGFPFWPMIETIDISLIDDLPTVIQVFNSIRSNFEIGHIFKAEEFREVNSQGIVEIFMDETRGIDIHFEPHGTFKKRVPQAIGLIRTGDSIPYANLIIESA